MAKLLITYPDFADIQMILTCHGELFVSNMEQRVMKKDKMERYMFLPADSLNERGVVIKYQDPSIPLLTARAKYENGELKDCAAKCRQAVECITGMLWKKIIPVVNGGISVQIRSLQSSPDLSQIARALCSATKSNKISGIDAIHSDLEKLIEQRVWNLLNKGTHIDETIPEFTRTEIKELLELIERLAQEVNDLKIKAAVAKK